MSTQLRLFRDIDSEDNLAFNNAKKLKSLAQEKLKDIDVNFQDSDDDSEYIIIQFRTNIIQIKESNSPDELRFFLRKIKSSFKLWTYKNGTVSYINKFDEKIREKDIEKIIPNWANKIYTENRIPLELFLDICVQNFSFSFLFDLIQDGFINQFVSENFEGKKVILFLSHKLIPLTDMLPESSYLTNLENKTEKFYHKVKEIADNENWLLAGCFRDFTRETILLKEFNTILEKENEKSNFKTLFANDYLFLNNVEFLSERPFTGGTWHSNIIKSPINLMAQKVLDNGNAYIYLREDRAAGFYRNEFYKKDLDINGYNLFSIILSQLHIKFVNEELRVEY
jgi:hypothetical protein